MTSTSSPTTPSVVAQALLGPAPRHRALRPLARGGRPRPGDRSPQALHRGGLLPLRRGGRHGTTNRDRQGDRAAHFAPRLHHCRPRRRSASERRPGSGVPRQPSHDHALWPSKDLPRPLCHPHSRHVRSRGEPLGKPVVLSAGLSLPALRQAIEGVSEIADYGRQRLDWHKRADHPVIGPTGF